MKKILTIGKHLQTVINYGLKFQKGIKTFNALMKHLQAFEEDRKQIWGNTSIIPETKERKEVKDVG